MSGFNYYGFSTQDILSTPLTLGNFQNNDGLNVTGLNRTIQGSEVSVSRNYRNEYGTINDLLSFTYCLMKSNLEPFSENEQIIIEKWLMSPKKSSLLQIIDCDGNVKFNYIGMFINTTWIMPFSHGRYGLCQFTFSVNGSYPYEHKTEQLINAGDNTLWDFTIPEDIDSDYIYPTLEITPHFDTYLPSDFRIINASDNFKQMKFQTSECEGIKIDCKRCIITGLGSDPPVLNFKNFGWEDVDAIYWLKLQPGLNSLRINGEGALDVILDYDIPIKKVGGWLI